MGGDALELYLMRHGVAAPGSGMTDAERPLTEEGAREVARAADGLVAVGIVFDRICTSPLVRARETARLVARAQPGRLEPEELDELAGGVVADLLFRAIGPVSDRARVLIVGHEPDMSALTAALTGAPADRAPVFAPGSIARIDLDRLPPSRAGALTWILTARLAAELAS